MDAVTLTGVTLGFPFDGVPAPIPAGVVAVGGRRLHQAMIQALLQREMEESLRRRQVEELFYDRFRARIATQIAEFEMAKRRMLDTAIFSTILSEI